MHRKTLWVLLIAQLAFLNACSKHKTSEENCQQLERGITTENKDDVKEVINRLIRQLPSDTYSSENLNRLAALVGQQCGVLATISCYNCINTLPSQSEIRIAGGTTEKIIDISYNANDKMVFVNMHN